MKYFSTEFSFTRKVTAQPGNQQKGAPSSYVPAAPPDTASPVPQSFLCLSLPQFWPSYAQRYKAKEAMSVCTRNTCRMQSQHFPFRGTFSFCPRASAGSQQYQATGCCWIPRTDCNMDRAEQGLMCTKDNCQDLFFFF